MSGEKEPGRDSEDFTAEELKEAHTDLFTDIYMQIYASFAKDYKTRHSEEEIARLEQDYQEFMIQIRTLTALQIRERFPQNIFAKKVIGVVVDILLEDKVLRQKVLSGEYDQFAIDSAKERAKEIRKRRKN